MNNLIKTLGVTACISLATLTSCKDNNSASGNGGDIEKKTNDNTYDNATGMSPNTTGSPTNDNNNRNDNGVNNGNNSNSNTTNNGKDSSRSRTTGSEMKR
jgi:hypothetical protein